MSYFNATNRTAFSVATTPTPKTTDVELVSPPVDSVSSLAFSPQADYLAVASWDNSANVRIYEVGQNGQSQGKAAYDHQGPVLNVCWSKDGSKVFSAGADNTGRMYDVATGQSAQVAQHDAPIRSVKWVDMHGGMLATGSWDRTLKYWDLRTPAPVATVQLPERCYAMDVNQSVLVVGTAERHIQIYDLNNPTVPFKTFSSPLKWQTRVISCFSDGIAIGSTEGRVGIQYASAASEARSYTFRCHRQEGATKAQSLVYSVNDISFHPIHGTFLTAGADGGLVYWDGDARIRMKALDTAPGPITSTAFNRTGSILAYSVCYDWHRGYSGMTSDQSVKVMLHACTGDEGKRRAPK